MYIYNGKKISAILFLAVAAVMIFFPASAYAESDKTTAQQEYTYREGESPTPVYGTGKRQVDRVEIIENLPDNDVERLPRLMAYSDTKGRGPGAGADGELVIAEVRYIPTGWDEDGIPNNYTACVYYRGEEAYSAVLYYEAVATHTGTRTGDGEPADTVVVIDEGEPPADEDPDSPPPIASEGERPDVPPPAVSEGEGPGPAGPAAPETEGTGTASSASSFRLPFSLAGLTPLGTAAIATIAAAVLMLVFLGAYNRRRIHESA